MGGAVGNLIDRVAAGLRDRLRGRVLGHAPLARLQRGRLRHHRRRLPCWCSTCCATRRARRAETRRPRRRGELDMHPRLFTLPPSTSSAAIGPVTLHTYGVLLAIAFLAGLWIANRQAQARRARPGARHRHGRLRPDRRPAWAPSSCCCSSSATTTRATRASCSRILQSGGVFYGGLLGALPGGVVVRRAATRSTAGGPPTCSRPGVAIGQAIGRLGCFAAGCCYGRPTDVPWAVTFRDAYATRTVGTPLDIAAAPDAALRVAGRARCIFWSCSGVAPRKHFHGQVVLAYVVALRGRPLRDRVLPRRRRARHRLRRLGLDLAVHRHPDGARRGRRSTRTCGGSSRPISRTGCRRRRPSRRPGPVTDASPPRRRRGRRRRAPRPLAGAAPARAQPRAPAGADRERRTCGSTGGRPRPRARLRGGPAPSPWSVPAPVAAAPAARGHPARASCTRTPTCSWWTSRPAWSSIPARAGPAARW